MFFVISRRIRSSCYRKSENISLKNVSLLPCAEYQTFFIKSSLSHRKRSLQTPGPAGTCSQKQWCCFLLRTKKMYSILLILDNHFKFTRCKFLQMFHKFSIHICQLLHFQGISCNPKLKKFFKMCRFTVHIILLILLLCV